jgi:predicted AlkP superfamily pyrophosphatase or phosphodiesterase
MATKPVRRAAVASLASVLTIVVGPAGALEAARRSSASPATHADSLVSARSAHVVVISVDGLRPDAIAAFQARVIQRLMVEGSYALDATTILPSKTLPSHTSMLTGTEPDQHGIVWNSEEMEEHGHVATPTIFASAKQAGLHTAAFFSKSKFQHLQTPGTLDYSQAPDGWPGKWLADRTVDDVEEYLHYNKPNLLFVHLGEPDFVGHVLGWMSTPYGWAVREADKEIGELIEAADAAFGTGNYTVILTSDHGGHGRNHGSDDARDVTIPWIAWGKGVLPGAQLAPGIRTMDTAATALWLLGIAPAAGAVGRAVEAAFVCGIRQTTHCGVSNITEPAR